MEISGEQLGLLRQMQQQPEFSAFTVAELEQIASRMRVKRIERGELLFEQGNAREWFYFVVSGLVRLFHRNIDGLERFYAFRHQGGVLPLVGMLTNEDYAYVAEACTPVEVVAIPMNCYEKLASANPIELTNIIRSMGQVIDLTENELQLMVTNNAKERIRQAIWFVGQQIGVTTDSGAMVIDYAISINDWAQISATSRETTSQVLQELKQQEVIDYERKHLTILRPELIGRPS